MTRFLAKGVEHTQGVQGEDWSPGIAGLRQKQVIVLQVASYTPIWYPERSSGLCHSDDHAVSLLP